MARSEGQLQGQRGSEVLKESQYIEEHTTKIITVLLGRYHAICYDWCYVRSARYLVQVWSTNKRTHRLTSKQCQL